MDLLHFIIILKQYLKFQNEIPKGAIMSKKCTKPQFV